MRVYIVTDTELGWDNIVAVYSTAAEAEKCAQSRGDTSQYDSAMVEDKYED